MELNIKDYLAKREKMQRELTNQISLLKKMPASVRAVACDEVKISQPYLLCDDYTLATDFRIEKRSDHISGSSGYDGGYSTDRYETYPQFYFKVGETGSSIRIDIRHPKYEEDKRVVIRSTTVTKGWKDYSSENRTQENDVDLDAVFGFFRKRGVSEGLLERLNNRIKEAKAFS